MEAFEAWLADIQKGKYGTNRLDGHREQVAAERGWKAALEWVKREAISLDERGDTNRRVIDKELNGE